MNLILSALQGLQQFVQLTDALKSGAAVGVSGVAQINRSHIIAAAASALQKPSVIVCLDELAARRTQAELSAFLGQEIPILPTRDLTFYDASSISREWEQQRLRQLHNLALGKTPLQIVTLEALALRTMPRELLLSCALQLTAQMTLPQERLLDRLQKSGYSRSTLVEGVGQYAVRGGIVDVFSPAHPQPLRIEFFGDEIDAMGFFDPVSQRRTENATQAIVLPVAETLACLHEGGTAGLLADLRALHARQLRRRVKNDALLQTLAKDADTLEAGLPFAAADRYLSLIYPAFSCAADYIPTDAMVFFCDHGNLRRASARQLDEQGMQLDSLLASGILCGELCEFSLDWEALCGRLAGRAAVFFDSFLATSYPQSLPPKLLLSIAAKQLPSYGGNLDTAASDLAFYQKNDFSSLVLCGNRRRGEILAELLRKKGLSAMLAFPLLQLPQKGQILLCDGTLPNGMEYPELRLAILTEGQLLAQTAQKSRKKNQKATNRQKLSSFTDLTPGDYIVHEYHGIGRYECMEQMKFDGVVKDYVKISYQGSDTLFVPATQLDLISKYIGGGEDKPVKLNRLGGDQWQKTKARAKAAVKDLAEGLIQLYAARKRLMGYAFAADTPWQAEFEQNFPYAETDDQLRCISEIKDDMESPQPMDRLLCGDVGFGKTEVALRGAMKAILDGKQVAILVPTTVLAQQHYTTAVNRFRGFPVNIAVLSRFCTPQQQKKTHSDLQAGAIDLVIGTHKLLQKDIVFKDLGLLIVDEEQRFGVTHKEKLKELSRGVDVLTLSATPIPRTLNMALSGLRDMSTIEEPPHDRYPVQTFVLEYAEPVLIDAMRREVERGGQVYFLHNRVETIAQCAARIKRALPDVEIALAHGKMSADELSEVMQRMADGEVKILVCTTIIETGIDLPNVNTLIIEDADKLGLAQLHQIRGRVGRSNRHAFAYLTFHRGKVLTEVAEKRLSAIRDYAEFGSGFKIAMRDLEIRGAGNLLGAAQSGHMLSVGYDMYLKLLEEAVLEERGEKPLAEVSCTADLDVTANIDKDYVSSGEQRMDLYRRMAAVRSQADADELLDEIVDRYGDPPKGVMNLIDVALLRAQAAAAGICDIAQKGRTIRYTLENFDFNVVSAVCAQYQKRAFLAPNSEKPVLTVNLAAKENPLAAARQFVNMYTQ
ncbi:MAG: transcription-repair coupling factor [Oscillospiraceae bacterium]|jgi:transcription-repair coupling factor (superfamily II helicase)|nr:transcription-repair coupling factor [Oscillospiraceae bacterium]